MANKEHVEILKQGISTWNKWRKENPKITPDLSKADISNTLIFRYTDLSGTNLSWANLSSVDLSGTNLSGTNIHGANLSKADLSEADLSEADLSEAKLCFANFCDADLSAANLSRVSFFGANLIGANLRGANLSGADLSEAKLSEANLSEAIVNDVKGIEVSQLIERGARVVDYSGFVEYENQIKSFWTDEKEGRRLSLMFEVDDGVTSETAVAEIGKVIGALSNYHIACDGQGLSLDDCQAFSFEDALVPGSVQ